MGASIKYYFLSHQICIFSPNHEEHGGEFLARNNNGFRWNKLGAETQFISMEFTQEMFQMICAFNGVEVRNIQLSEACIYFHLLTICLISMEM